LQTTCDENIIITDSLLLKPKSASDGLYEPLVIGLNVVVYICIANRGRMKSFVMGLVHKVFSLRWPLICHRRKVLGIHPLRVLPTSCPARRGNSNHFELVQ